MLTIESVLNIIVLTAAFIAILSTILIALVAFIVDCCDLSI